MWFLQRQQFCRIVNFGGDCSFKLRYDRLGKISKSCAHFIQICGGVFQKTPGADIFEDGFEPGKIDIWENTSSRDP